MVELGTGGRLLALQLDELVAGTDAERELLALDYVPAAAAGRQHAMDASLTYLRRLSPDELLDVAAVAAALGFGRPDALDHAVSPHGYRMLAKVPRLPRPAVERLVEHFDGLQKLLAASVEDLQQVAGISESHARSIREGLARLAESSIIERYV